MDKKLNLYFFGEIGTYDKYNPSYICSKKFIPEILYLIAYNEPFSITKNEIIEKLKIDNEKFDDLILSLKIINAIDIKENRYKINFPVFLERDIDILNKHLVDIGAIIGKKIIEMSQLLNDKISNLENHNYFSKERLLYHIICDDVFDDTAFDFLAERNIISISKRQPGNRDYIIIGYEDCEEVEVHSNRLLCSSNNYSSKNFTFNSFGDSDGIRKDVYRFFRKTQKSLETVTPFQNLNLSYIKLVDDINDLIIEKCGEMMLKCFSKEISYNDLSREEQDIVDFLKELNYLTINKESHIISCNIPVFKKEDDKVINEISNIILNHIFGIVKSTFEEVENKATGLTSIRHKVSIKEIGNELWHQIFGLTNEYLARKGFVQLPEHVKGEGRYLRSLRVK
ncbi:hypothetical protein KQI42_13430 [Tissierella sp. MSJ-40]|uniref:Uncharacterized protein n=1 Tax=Tissierella simiarum TaxID=2841534 RepID=A0ABS6E8D0_9FIRM|nr:hypothetical protein [Tissierella simiarum]MBU5439024.1 hypothetical protein [Tissierella simiarum]